MLKLKRASREGMISVIMRDKEYLFTRPFALALTIAVSIHLTLILLFHVAPFKIGSNNTVFTPTNVEADAASTESVVADFKPTVQTIRGLPAAPSSSPTLSLHPKFLTIRPVEYTKAESSTDQAFTQIEQKIYQPEFHPLIHSPQKPLEILVSGILGERELLSDGMDATNGKSIPKFFTPKTDSKRVIYSVMVEGRTGKVFWFEPAQLTGDVAIDKYAENVLRDMKFAIDTKAIAVSGTIELQFNPETGANK